MINTKTKINYEFIDYIRFIAIISIVVEHSYFWPIGLYFKNLPEQVIQTFSMQIFKFGSVIFFLLAGFLIGDKIGQYKPLEYLKRRFDNTFKPWLFWVGIYVLIEYINSVVGYLRFGGTDAFSKPGTYLYDLITYVLFETSFWFIINFLVGIAILMLFRKYIYSFKFGLILGLCSLFYAVNIYYDWIPSRHTSAFLGFVFYIWLGVQMNKYYADFLNWVNKTTFASIIIVCIFSFFLASAESLYLTNFHLKTDPYNTLRVTNILYSLVAFLLLFKIGNINWIKNLNPRSTTFGIYLIHYSIIVQGLPLIFRPLNIDYLHKGALFLFGFQLIRFVIAFIVSYLLTIIIGKSKRIKWIVGQ